MNCIYCREPVEDLGPTLPRSAHLECVAAIPDDIEAAQRALFVDSIPASRTIEFRPYGNLTAASATEIRVTHSQHGVLHPDGTWTVRNER